MKKKILVVDNNKVILKLMTNMLQKMGHEVKTAEDGLSALEVLKSYHPDVMFVDLIMPNIAGDILCRIIRKNSEFDSIFITIVSAVALEEKIDFLSFGADACIAKGSPKGMRKHITSVLALAEEKDILSFNKTILGAQDVHVREVSKELLTTKKHFEITLDNMEDGFLELTWSDKIVFANSMATALFNTSEEKLLSTNFLDNFDEHQRDYLAIYLDQTHQNPVELGEDYPIQVNGKYLLLKFIPIVEQEQKSIIVLMKDITQRKHAEHKLQEHMAHLEQLVVERTAELQNTNKLLWEKEHFQEKLLNDMVTFVAVLEPNGDVIFVNNTPLMIGGLKLEDVIEKKFFDAPWWTHSDEVRNHVKHDIERCCSGESLVHDIQIQIADGSLMWIEYSMHPIFDEDGAVQYLIPEGRDISDRKNTEIAIRKSEKLWDRTFNSFTDIVTIQDIDMNIVKINQVGCDVLNLNNNEIIGKSCHELFHGSNEPCPDCPLLITRESFEPYSREMTHEKLGKTFLVSATPVLDDQKNLIHIAHVAKDITDSKKSEENRIRLAAAIDQAAEAIVITGTNGNIQYINPAFENITGYKRAEVIGQNPRFLKSGKHDAKFYEEMWATLLQGNVWKGHLINRKKDGSLYEEETTISPVKNSKGEITNFVAVKYDISKEISLEKQLRQAMKMEAIGTLAGGIAHDFNNILAAILGYSEMARVELSDDAPIAQDLDQIIIAGKRATELVKQILTFSRQGEEDLKPFKIQLIVKEVLKLLRSSLPATIQLKQDIADNTGLILADPTQMHQVLMNLCTNAKHAIDADKGGTLSISLSEVHVTDSDTIADCPQLEYGSYLDLSISDTGCGMDGLTLSRIFDPFFTTKEKGKGTGLGLAVVHGIIKQHKGEITVASELGQRTTFHVYLPVIEEEIQAEKVITEEIPRGSERILLVDNETALVELMQRLLNKLGYTVTSFTSSIEALAAYEKNPDDFDLVITDMTMPGMTGTALAKKLFAIRSDLPVILCTGFSETIDEKKAKSLGICEYIKKPVDGFTLAKAVRAALKC